MMGNKIKEKEFPCVLCGKTCFLWENKGGERVVHKINRKGVKPIYVHASCFEALLPKKEKVIK